MPPVRTVPPAKAVKTERTHEENQERAYIAASRRSDRSLEARVESARRASEIHKRRTGRSLRVTEQDVINEEMYEEEDDDLPFQYRRLTAHLQTGSADFNRRLAAYLTNHVAMRAALDQAITSSYAQTFTNAPQFPHNHTMFQQPLTNPQMMQHNPAMFRHTPYPMAADALMQPQRSISTPRQQQQQQPQPQQASTNNSPYPSITSQSPTDPSHMRRMSMSSTNTLVSTNTSPVSAPAPHVHLPQSRPAPKQTPNPSPIQADYQQKLLMHQQQQLMQQAPRMRENPNSDLTSPFSTALPANAQMFLGGALDPLDPLTSQMMTGSEHFPNYMNYNAYNMNGILKQPHTSTHSAYDGLNSTLAPSVLDSAYDDYSATLDPSFGLHFDNAFTDTSKPLSLTRNSSSLGAGESGTPGIEKEWATFIENDWDQGASA